MSTDATTYHGHPDSHIDYPASTDPLALALLQSATQIYATAYPTANHLDEEQAVDKAYTLYTNILDILEEDEDE
jgi:hypothetical protein